MAYNTKNIIRDAVGAPVPQVYNPAADEYQVLQGRNGASRVEIYGPDGTPISSTAGKLDVRAAEIETILADRLPSALTTGGGLKAGLVDALPAGENTIGRVQLTDGTRMLAINADGSLLMVPRGNNMQVGSDLSATWANSAPANTQVTLDISLPTIIPAGSEYLVEIYNPSSVTSLAVIAQTRSASFGGATRYPELARWTIAATKVKAYLLRGWLLDGGGRLVLSNNTALGGSDGFTAYIRVIMA